MWDAVPGSQPLSGGLAGFFSFRACFPALFPAWHQQFHFLACNTSVELTFSFGGTFWPVDSADMNLGPLGGGQCLGGLFELSDQVGNISWVMGETFLVCLLLIYRSVIYSFFF